MKKLKAQRGITLIALIITIIVMLILVAVTVTVALNGGLFKTAKEGASKTELEKEKELLLEIVMGAIGKDGKVNFSNIEECDIIETINRDTGVVTTKSGRTYTITQRGSIILDENAGGGGVITPPEEPEEPSNPGTGEEPDVGNPSEAGLYAADGTFTPWTDLLNSGMVTVENGVLTQFNGYDTNTWEPTATGRLVIHNSVTSIGNLAFYMCAGLTSVTIPNGVTSIGVSAFETCINLTEVNIPDNVTTISSSAFFSCRGLTQVNIPNGVTSIDSSAFGDCTGLTQVNIPNSVTSIGYGAFTGCKNLAQVNIPSSVTSIGDSAFVNCTGLNEINVEDSNNNYCSDNGVLYDENKTTLIQYPTAKTSSSFTIPNSVKNISNNAFSYCTNLISVTIPSGVTSIGDNAFDNCTGLNSLELPNSVASIGTFTFSYCTALTSLAIPTSVTSIGYGAFWQCTSLTATVLGTNANIDWRAFSGVPTVYYAGYVEGYDYSSWEAGSVLPLPSET